MLLLSDTKRYFMYKFYYYNWPQWIQIITHLRMRHNSSLNKLITCSSKMSSFLTDKTHAHFLRTKFSRIMFCTAVRIYKTTEYIRDYRNTGFYWPVVYKEQIIFCAPCDTFNISIRIYEHKSNQTIHILTVLYITLRTQQIFNLIMYSVISRLSMWPEVTI